jgi:hypothetical protein
LFDGLSLRGRWLTFLSILALVVVTFLKALSGASLALLVIIMYLFKESKTREDMNALLGAIFIALILGVIAALLPTFYHPVVNYVGFPVVVYGLILLFGRRRQSRRAPTS